MALLLVLSPFLLLVAIAIRVDSPGSVLFLQERMGQLGRPFTIFKFRTMRIGGENEGLGIATAADDARITRVGAWLRRTGIDEIPQLLNILLGEMSFIGPRPTLRAQVEAYTPRQSRRLLFRPGVTGWAQVHGRNRLSWEERIELDLHYVDHFSLWMDLRILWRTIIVVRSGDGVYGRHTTSQPPVKEPSMKTEEQPPILVIGAGRYARDLIHAIELEGRFQIKGIVDVNTECSEDEVFGHAVLRGRDVLQQPETPRRAFVAIPSSSVRGAWITHLSGLEFELPSLVHPSAMVGRNVEIGAGSALLAGSIVNCGSRLGRGVVLHIGTCVDHDCLLGDLVHLAPGARIAANVHVGARSHIGIGACVTQGLEIGPDSIISAGAAVVAAIPAGATAGGVPARVLRLTSSAPVQSPSPHDSSLHQT
jgi:sugar O-acyltransferase (sialic acid O-acetyltransferase NeuD family)